MTLQYFNSSINGFLFANDQHIINVNYDDTDPFSSFLYQIYDSASLSLNPPPCILSTIFLLLKPIHKFPSAKLNSPLCPQLGISLNHTLLGSIYIYIYFMLQISIQKGIVNVYFFPFKFSIRILATTSLKVTSLITGE